ncbi:MAG: TonB-dependent receptor [Emcibacter sp.]|nr:TonB-dependent receptor [Emcibacter sp.]
MTTLNQSGKIKESIFTSGNKEWRRGLLQTTAVMFGCASILMGSSAALADSSTLDEIVVTALKRTQSLQDVSVSVAVLDRQQLEDRHVVDIKDLQLYIPSITINDSFGTPQISSRGLGLNSVSAGIDPAVGFYVDGAVINTPVAQLFSLFDLERVEVLSGPQGSLFGRNTMAGAINLITSKPSEEFEAYGRLTIGNYAAVETDGAIGGTLFDGVLARLAWRTVNRSGFGENQFTGADVDNQNQQMLRGQIKLIPSEDVDLLLSVEYAKQDDRGLVFKFKEVTFANLPSKAAPGLGGFPVGNPRDISTEFDPQNDRETLSVTGTLNWAASEELAFKGIVNYRDVDVNLIQDLDLSSVVQREDVNGVGGTNQERPINSEQFSAELQINYAADFAGLPLDFVGGFFYFNEENSTTNTIGFQPKNGRPRALPGGGTTFDKRVQLSGTKNTDSWAAFWSVRYDVMPEVTLKLGGRYTEDKISVLKENLIFVANGLGPQKSIAPFDDSKKFAKYTSEFGIEWRPTDDMMLYYTYSEGFKAGTVPIGSTSGQGFVDPETVKNNEFGIKSTWIDGELTLNVSGFFYTAKDLQLQRSLPTGAGGFTLTLANAADLKAHGAEASVVWRPTESFRLSGSFAWLETAFQEGFVSVDPINPLQFSDAAAAQQNLSGNSAVQSPKWSGSVHAAYDLPFHPGGGQLTVGSNLSFKGEHFFSEFNNERLKQDAYTILDVSLKFVPADDRWSAELWAKNLTDEMVETGNFSLGTGLIIARTFLAPRTYGATVKFTF